MIQIPRRLFAFLLLLVMSSMLVAACSQTGENGSSAPTSGSGEETTAPTDDGASTADSGDKVLRMGLRLWPGNLDPQKVSWTEEIAVVLLNYEGLTRLDENLEVVPGAAESWEYNEDSTEITFKLREDLTYSDGSPLTAEDFAYAAYRTLSPENPGYYQTTLDMIKGAEQVINGEGEQDALAISTPDERTITFELTKPTPYFHTLASLWILFPVKQTLVEEGGEFWYEQAENMLGNGPFQITSIDDISQELAFVANENYWQGKPQLDGLRLIAIEDLAVALQAYKAGEIDVVVPNSADIPGIKADPELSNELLQFSGSCTAFYAFNPTLPPFDDKLVREAFAYALDRDAFIQDALNGTAVKTLTWIPPGYPGYDAEETRYDYDPEKAKELLVEAGYPDGEGMPPITYTYDSTNPSIRVTVEYVVQMWQNNLGVTIQTDPVDGDTFSELLGSVETHPLLVVDGWCADYPDPQNWLSTYWHSDSMLAQTRAYSNPDFDQLIDEADVEPDPEKRIELYQEAQRILIDDVPFVLRSNGMNTYLVKPYVKGLTQTTVTPQDVELPGSQTGLLNVTIEP
jgi:oligopeptide transport system substrate-binding protein